MSWWRRDPTLAPVHRYAQRVLRSREAALRTRCFSRSPRTSAKHDDDEGQRPAGLSNLEWMQLQHYKRWRKTFRDDPYRALFGASNDMLNGKGLANWEWVSRSFPSWMVGDMEGEEPKRAKEDKAPGQNGKHSAANVNPTARPDERPSARSTTDKSNAAGNPYPKKVNLVEESDQRPEERDSFFPQPSIRSSRYTRDESGITSPSDLRRPREQPHHTIKSYDPASTLKENSARSPPMFTSTNSTTLEQSDIFDGPISGPLQSNTQAPNKEASARESSFIEEFFSEKAQDVNQRTEAKKDDIPWAQTALQRRLSAKFGPGAERKNTASIESSYDPLAAFRNRQESLEGNGVEQNLGKTRAERHGQQQVLNDLQGAESDPTLSKERKNRIEDKDIQQPQSKDNEESGKPTKPSTRSTSDILKQLPKDDIDFLTAADIRASMAATRVLVDGKLKQESQSRPFGRTQREFLDIKFDENSRRDPAGDDLIESRIINEHHRRQREREPQDKDVPEVSTASTLEWMKTWLEKSGNSFASHFWQDPTEEADARKTRLYFDKVVTRIRKGRLAMEEIVDDLKACVPASKSLLRRLNEDEELLDSAIQNLRQRSPTRDWPGMTPKKLRTIQALRLKFKDTDRELEEAYETLRLESEGDWIERVPLAFKRKINIASKIMHQNASLTRSLVWSLQARFEDREIDPKLLSNYTAVVNSLLALRDTQMALARLVDRAMLTYKVVPSKLEDMKVTRQSDRVAVPTESNASSQGPIPFVPSLINTANIRENVAAGEQLASEVEAQKFAMQGMSDDGYAQSSKALYKKTFDEQSPLAHSLFRPFGPVLASLGKDGVEEVEAKPTREEPNYATEEAFREEGRDVEIMEAWKNDIPKETVAGSSPEKVVQSSAMVPSYTPTIGNEAPRHITQAINDNAIAKEVPATITASTPVSSADPQAPPFLSTSSGLSTTPFSPLNLPTNYTILIYDPETEILSLTTSTTAPPRDTTPALPLHHALTTLSAPAKFIPFITPGLEVVSATTHMLILRNALDSSTASTRGFEIARSTAESDGAEDSEMERMQINPIDGTARLSPTGYVGPEESPEQLEKEFEERRQAAGRLRDVEKLARAQREIEGKERRKGRGRGGVARVLRTVVWAGAVCYVAGVVGEIYS